MTLAGHDVDAGPSASSHASGVPKVCQSQSAFPQTHTVSESAGLSSGRNISPVIDHRPERGS